MKVIPSVSVIGFAPAREIDECAFLIAYLFCNQ